MNKTISVAIPGLSSIELSVDPDLKSRDLEALNNDLKVQLTDKLGELITKECYFSSQDVDARYPPSDEECSMVIKAIKVASEEYSLYLEYCNQNNQAPTETYESFLRTNLSEMSEANADPDWAITVANVALGNEYTKVIRCNVLDALEDAGITALNEVWGQEFEEEVQEVVTQSLEENDRFDPMEILGKVNEVHLAYLPGGLDEDLEFSSMQQSTETLVPNKALGDLLDMAGIGRRAMLEHLGRGSVSRPDEWEAFCNEKPDLPGRQPSVTLDEMVDVLDNLGYSGIPSYVMRVSTTELVEMAQSTSETVTVKGGGQMGVHDYFNGSGHLVDVTGPVMLSSNLDHWHDCEGTNHIGNYPVNEVYGMVGRAYDAELEIPQGPESKEQTLGL